MKLHGETIASCYRKHRVLLEPHGAVAWKGLENYMLNEPYSENEETIYISLETAHPAKFPDEIHRILNFTPSTPDSLEKLANLHGS